MSNTNTVEAIDLQVGMVYRLFESHDWATIKHLSYTFRRGNVHGVNIRTVERGNRHYWFGAHERITIKEQQQ